MPSSTAPYLWVIRIVSLRSPSIVALLELLIKLKQRRFSLPEIAAPFRAEIGERSRKTGRPRFAMIFYIELERPRAPFGYIIDILYISCDDVRSAPLICAAKKTAVTANATSNAPAIIRQLIHIAPRL